jgi:hypothetical protein
MDILKGDEIAEAQLTDWRKLAQGLHARYLVADFGTEPLTRGPVLVAVPEPQVRSTSRSVWRPR